MPTRKPAIKVLSHEEVEGERNKITATLVRKLGNRAIRDVTNRTAYRGTVGQKYGGLKRHVKSKGTEFKRATKQTAPWFKDLLQLAEKLEEIISTKWNEISQSCNLEEGYGQKELFEQLAKDTIAEIRAITADAIYSLRDHNGMRGVTNPTHIRF